ncbi:MAG: hypothetical protein KIT43_04965 [Bauldia sp.]|nr:hypothetical protein [Bauldia sp.]MCW5717197.1 hypothetical protein [Bauldia sp.]
MTTMITASRRVSPRSIALAGTFLAALTLAACGEAADDTPTTTDTPVTTLETAPPAMEAAAPAMEAAPPAMAAAPADETATTLTIGNLVGDWAADTAACNTPSEVTTITATTFSGGGMTRTVASATPGVDGLDVVLTGTVDNVPVTETWTFEPAGTTPPLTGVNVTMGGETAVAWVRCPAPATTTPGLTPVP